MDLLSYILAVKNAVKPTDDQVKTAVTEHLTAHPVTPGASEEEAKQITQNTADIADLKASRITAKIVDNVLVVGYEETEEAT